MWAIDQVAHEAALQVSYGGTIAVLSEYPLGTPPLPENFPRRNRVLSDLSYGTFVVEAHSRSGSLITAHQAVEQRREPGSVDQLTSRGTHQLIKEGACLVETQEDILLVLADRLKWKNKFEPVLAEQSIAAPVSTERSDAVEKKEDGSNSDSLKYGGIGGSPDSLSIEKEELQGGHLFRPGADAPGVLRRIGETPQEEEPLILELLKEEGPLAPDEMVECTGRESSKLSVFFENGTKLNGLKRERWEVQQQVTVTFCFSLSSSIKLHCSPAVNSRVIVIKSFDRRVFPL